MHASCLSKLLVFLITITSGFAFHSCRSIISLKNGVRLSTKPQNPCSSTLLCATLVISQDPSVSFGVSVVNAGSNGNEDIHKCDTDAPFLHPSVTWLSSFSSYDDDDKDTATKIPPLSSFGTVHALLQGKEDAENLIQNIIPGLSSLTCLGIHVVLGASSSNNSEQVENNNMMVAPETAQRVGALLQEILDAVEMIHPSTTTIVIMSLDLPVHLAMLQANCLPKTRTTTTNNRHFFHVLQQHTKEGRYCKSILAEYLYDWDNPFGGTDPLACPSREVCSALVLPILQEEDGVVVGPISVSSALTALLGLGLEPFDAVRDAQIVAKSVQGYSSSSDFLWEEGVQRFLASYSSCKVQVWSEDGILRKEYIEFGYK